MVADAAAGLDSASIVTTLRLWGVCLRACGSRGSGSVPRTVSRGRRLATLGKRTSLWDVESRERIAGVLPLSNASDVDIAPDDGRVVVKNTSGDVAVYDAALSEELLRLPGRPWGEGSAIRFSPCGRFLVDGSWNGDLLVRDAVTGEIVFHERGEHVSPLACTRDRRVWVYVRNAVVAYVRQWPFEQHEPIRFSEVGMIWRAGLSDDGNLAVVLRGHYLEVWRLDRANARKEVVGQVELEDGMGAVALSPTGDRVGLASVSRMEGLLLTRELGYLGRVPFEYPSDVAFSPDSKLIAFGDGSKGVVLPVADLLP